MELRQLENFFQVCNEMSFTNAAKKAYITQQGLSKSIALLEKNLGAELFVRTSNKIALTESGTYLYERCKILFNFLDETVDVIHHIQDDQNQELLIGCNKGVYSALPGEFIPRFRQACGQLNIIFREHTLYECEEMVAQSEIPVAIIVGAPASKKVETILLRRMPVCLVMSHEHPLAEKEHIQIADLRSFGVVAIGEHNELNYNIRNLCRESGSSASSICYVTDFISMHNICANSNDIGISFSEVQTNFNMNRLIYKTLDDPRLVWEINIIVKRNAELTYTVSRFIRCLRNAVAEKGLA